MRLLFSFVFLFFGFQLFAQSETCWPNSRGDLQLNGVTPVEFPQKVKLKWTYDANGIFKSAPVVCDDKIVVGSTNGTLYCLNMKGDSLWGFKTDNSIEAPALIHNNTVYFGNLSGSFFALDLNTGRQIWEYKTENQIMGAPTLFQKGDKTILAVGSYDYYLHGVDAQTGKGLWKYESDNFLNSAPALAVDKAVFGGCDGFLHLVNMTDGSLAGKVEIATYVASSPAVKNNLAYIGDYDGGFNCIDLKEKKIKWRYENPDSDLPFISSPSLIGERVLIGSRDKFLYCFNRETGALIWKKNTGRNIDASTVANKKQVLLVNMRGDVQLLNISDGSVVWNYQLGVSAIKAPAVIKNSIIIAGSDGNVYCLTSPQVSPSPSQGGE